MPFTLAAAVASAAVGALSLLLGYGLAGHSGTSLEGRMGCWALCALALLAVAVQGVAAYLPTHLTTMTTADGEKAVVSLGIVLPYSSFKHRLRSYQKKINDTLSDIKKNKYPSYKSLVMYDVVPVMENLQLTPSPTDILRILCHKFLNKNVSAILYIPSVDPFGGNAASAQYFLQLTGYLGIPVIVWNAAGNHGLEMGTMLPTVRKRLSGLFTASPTVAVDPHGADDSEEDGDIRTTPSTGHRKSPHASTTPKKAFNSIFLQLAPTLIHQTLAMLSIMRRYSWHQFSIVTTQITGYTTFIEAVKDNLQTEDSEFRFNLLTVVKLETTSHDELLRKLGELRNTDTRIILLYATKEEAAAIFSASKDLDLTGKDYVWIVTQSVIGNLAVPSNFSPGMIGVHFDTGENSIQAEMEKGVRVFFEGLELFVNDHQTANVSLHPNLSCSGEGNSRWTNGELFYKYLLNVSIPISPLKPKLEFSSEGAIKSAELEVMNLNEQLQWTAIGTWNGDRLDIKDIVWPGNSHVPPPGVPEKFHLKVTFLEEPPFVMLSPRDPITGKCINKGVMCRVAKDSEMIGVNMSMSGRNSSFFQCCSGFCIDLLQKFANDLGFTYELVRVEDDVWGTEINGKWNGLVGALLNHTTDVVMTALNINSFREAVIDFTVPFMETGIAIVVAKRTGIISPKAFLEPFDTVSWLLILLVSIQVAALAIFLFEWLSPTGYDMKIQPPRDHKFSLFRTYWLVWAILFGAAVNVDCPRGYTARCMSNLWAMFAVVFLAIYTANLAAFMITREEYYDLAGIEDKRLLNPYSIKPPFKYGTMPMGNSETILSKAFPEMESYMKQHNKRDVWEGVQAVKRGELNAFIYDATVLDYLVSQDDECKLLTVGSWYAMTGYGVAFPRNSKHLNSFNKYMMIYRENGDLERLRRFWMQGACKPDKQRGKEASKPLSLGQFMSAFLLLGCGMLLAILLLLLEHIYFKYLRKHLAKKDTGGCCTLISLSMGRSLTFRGAVYEAQDMLKNHRCRDPMCDTHLWKVRHELDMAKLKIRQLEKELYSRGYSHSNRPYYIPISYNEYSDYVLHSRDMTRNHVTTNEPMRGYTGVPTKYHSGYYYSPVKNEITEIETVL